jgi:hypothetical protein
MCIKINKVGKQEVGILRVQKRFPRYRVPIWSLWPNIRSLPSIVAENNVTKNVHICSMCIITNYVGKQEVGIGRVQTRFPQYGIPIWGYLFFLIIPPSPKYNSIPPEGGGGYTVIPLSVCLSVRPSFLPSKIFFVAFFSATVDGRNLIFGHKRHIGIPYCG